MPSCLPGHTTQRWRAPQARRHTFPHHPRLSEERGCTISSSRNWPGSILPPLTWGLNQKSPERPRPPLPPASCVEIPSEWKTEKVFSWRYWQNLPLYFYNLYISSSFYKQKTKQEKAHDSFICSPVQQRGHACPAPSLLFWKWTLEIFPVRDWGCSLFPITLLEVTWLASLF